jgi:hypothetical protein
MNRAVCEGKSDLSIFSIERFTIGLKMPSVSRIATAVLAAAACESKTKLF